MRPRAAHSPIVERGWLIALALWAALVTYGGAKLVIFGATPGVGATAASYEAGKRGHLYVFFHPLCPCSNATLTELGRIKDRAIGQIDMTAIVDAAGFGVSQTRQLREQLGALPGLAVELDADGRETASFGARTSGQILLYDARGRLEFSGGITDSRGHDGDNAGEQAILDIVGGKVPRTHSTPTFGCELSTPVERR